MKICIRTAKTVFIGKCIVHSTYINKKEFLNGLSIQRKKLLNKSRKFLKIKPQINLNTSFKTNTQIQRLNL